MAHHRRPVAIVRIRPNNMILEILDFLDFPKRNGRDAPLPNHKPSAISH